ncbi:MAG: hypothetical protein WC069_01050 [Candidatus Shapirobacteria bacterium]
MEISLYGSKSLYIKGKVASVWLDPEAKNLNENNAKIIMFDKIEDNFLGLDTGEQVAIWGPGEYEVSGIEINVSRVGNGLMSIFNIDEVKLGWISTDAIDLTDKKKERLAECDVLIIKSVGEIKNVWELIKGMGINYLIMTNLSEEDKKKLLDMADMEETAVIDTLKLEKSTLPEVMEVVILQQK